jgi:hypothetical protein
VDHPDKRFDFSAVELASAFGRDPDRFRVLTHKLQTHPTLYWGYSMNDAGPLNALDPKIRGDRPIKPKWMVLREPTPAQIEYFSALKFNIIVADTADVLDFVSGVKPTTKADPSRFIEQFSSDRIPAISEIPPRPITRFFLGAAPSWYDILTSRVYKTAHYHAVTDTIHRGENVLLVGIPQCGKTTLLMMVAAGLDTAQHRLFAGHLTPEKARQICNATSPRRKAIVFVDDAANSIAGINVLLACPTVQVVATDRTYSIEIIGHLIQRDKLKLYDVTDLSKEDVLALIRSIPESVALQTPRVPEVAKGKSPSIFEIVAVNVRDQMLLDKYREVLPELDRKNRDLHDLFVMMCYMHACRTPVSFEVVWAFCDHSLDYKLVYKRVESLGSLLAELDLSLDDELGGNQDYFVARSTVVAQNVIKHCGQMAFRRVFERFHQEVSPLRIPQYDVFRRMGYDADFVVKAFPSWKEGAEFYERTFEIDENFYLLQQGALYLKSKKRFKEAFDFIDRALDMSRGRNPRIRNTHAIILFDANLAFASTSGEARRSLEQAMQILQQCRTQDKHRTSYHAYTFAEQACDYFDLFPDEKGKQYLLAAEKWLKEEMRNALARRRAQGYLERVRQRLG